MSNLSVSHGNSVYSQARFKCRLWISRKLLEALYVYVINELNTTKLISEIIELLKSLKDFAADIKDIILHYADELASKILYNL